MSWRRRAVALLIFLPLLLAAVGNRAGAHSRLIWAGNGACRDIAFTYDTEFSGTTPSLLDVIDAAGARVTWFLTGDTADAEAALVRRMAARHQLANHTFSHPHLPELTEDQQRQELALADAAITRVAGRSPRPLFRPPYGEYDDKLLVVAESEGYPLVIMWTVLPGDHGNPPAEQTHRRIMDGARPGAIVLMHGSPPNTVEASRMAIRDLQALGYQFVTVTEILGIDRSARDFGGESYVVQSGDSFAWIAACHNLSTARLQAYNEAVTVPPGYVLRIPHLTEVIVRVDGARQDFPVYPRLTGGRAVAHIRLAEQLGATVSWDGTRVNVVKESKVVEITPGSATALVNGTPVEMGAAAFAETGRVLAPVRFIANELGASVAWDGETFTVLVAR